MSYPNDDRMWHRRGFELIWMYALVYGHQVSQYQNGENVFKYDGVQPPVVHIIPS